MTNKRAKTYLHTRPDGRTVRLTVPEDPASEELLLDALRDNLSPHAIATIVSYLQPARTNNPQVDRQVTWFREQLFNMLGAAGFDEACAELGL